MTRPQRALCTLLEMDRWDGGADYDMFMGRWSRLVAGEFVRSLKRGTGLRWLDVGCGTGALLESVVDAVGPSALWGVDPSEHFVAVAQSRVSGNAELQVADGENLPFQDNEFDVVVSGLVLNFIPDPKAALVEWRRVTKPGGLITAYVWDYAKGMGFLRYFWDAAIGLDPRAEEFDEGVRFPLCEPDQLRHLFEEAGLSSVATGSVEVPTNFTDFDDYWRPFLLGQGPAPGYLESLDPEQRIRLEESLRKALPQSSNGVIELRARAWSVSGIG